MEGSLYHSLLRVAALVLAFLLVFDSGVLIPKTVEISHTTQKYLANAVGVYASVESTELNTLTAELSAWQRSLEEREQALSNSERAISIGLSDGNERFNFSTYVLSILLFIILVLIILNYVLDFIRQRRLMSEVAYEQKTIS